MAWYSNIFKRSNEELDNGSSFVLDFGSLQSKSQPLTLSAVYRAVTLISESIAMCDWEVYERTDKRKGYSAYVADSNIQPILQRPNPMQSRQYLVSMMMYDCLLYGTGYAYIERSGSVKNLWYVPYGNVTTYAPKTATGQCFYKVRGISDTMLTGDDLLIIHCKPDPNTFGCTGITPLTYASRTLQIGYKSEKKASKYFEQGGGAVGMLSSKSQRLNKTQQDELLNTWNSTIKNTEGSGLIICPADLEYTPLSLNSKDAQLLETRQFTVAEIARFFGVQPTKLFDYSASKYSTIEADNLSFLMELTPYITKFETELNNKIWTDTERAKYQIRLSVDAFSRTDKAAQAEWISKLFGVGGLTINELRDYIDMPSLTDDYANKPFVQANLLTAEKAAYQEVKIDNNQL